MEDIYNAINLVPYVYKGANCSEINIYIPEHGDSCEIYNDFGECMYIGSTTGKSRFLKDLFNGKYSC